MADETHTDSAPLTPIVAEPSVFDPRPVDVKKWSDPPAEPVPEPAAETAAQQLSAFEEKYLGAPGAPAIRIGGDIERGAGSRYQQLTVEQRAHHAALENLVAAEKKMAAASLALAAAEAEHAAATTKHEAAAAGVEKEADAPEAA